MPISDYQDHQISSGGAFAISMKSAQRPFNRMSKVTMFAGDPGVSSELGDGGKSPFFDFPSKKLDGTEVARLGDLVDGKKAILVVNVASE